MLAAAMLSMVSPATAGEQPAGPYLGVGGMISRLAPDTGADPRWDGSASRTEGMGVAAGYRFGDRLALEAGAARLGRATLGQGASIGYEVMSLSALGHWSLGRGAWSLTGRLGVGTLSDDPKNVETTMATGAQAVIGLGVRRRLSDRFQLRAEVVHQGEDIAYAGAGILWYPLGERTKVQAYEPEPPKRTRVQAAPLTAADRAPRGPDRWADGVQPDITFYPGAQTLTESGRAAIDRLGVQMGEHPGIGIEIQAHVSELGDAALDKELGGMRVRTIARRLIAAGVDVARLRARTFGATGGDSHVRIRTIDSEGAG